jgi:hypothetical protein
MCHVGLMQVTRITRWLLYPHAICLCCYFHMRELHMIYARCLFYEMIMVVTGPLMDLLDRHRLGCSRLYASLDGLYGRAWDALYDARSEKAFEPLSGRVGALAGSVPPVRFPVDEFVSSSYLGTARHSENRGRSASRVVLPHAP